MDVLTAGHLFEVRDLLVTPDGVAGCHVGVEVAGAQPGVVVPSEAGGRSCACLHAALDVLELTKGPCATWDEETFVHRDDLLLVA